MPASNIILIPGRGDLGLCPLICCVTGGVLPGMYSGQQKHTAGGKGKTPQMGKHKGYARGDNKGSKLPCGLGRTRPGMEPQAFVLFCSP